MRISILLPHFKVGKMTAYAISQLLKFKGKHEIEIFIIDNNSGDGSLEYIQPFLNDVKVFDYPKDRLQSHGAAFDYILPQVTTDYFITIESDSFPTKENWLNSYEKLINDGFECAGSLMKLSGGTYLHPAGALYKRSVWQEAKEYCDNIAYDYFPNMATKEGFDCHLMIKKSQLNRVLEDPKEYMDLAKDYEGLSMDQMLAKRDYYKPVTGVFHNGMGNLQESIKTFGERNTSTGMMDALLDNKQPLIFRIGYEPGEWFCFYQLAMGKKIALISTEIKWMKNRGGQQQEYTLMANGFTHIWGISAYHKANIEGMEDVISFKENQVEQLYNSLPENQKVKI